MVNGKLAVQLPLQVIGDTQGREKITGGVLGEYSYHPKDLRNQNMVIRVYRAPHKVIISGTW